jgi:hypothetical protein
LPGKSITWQVMDSDCKFQFQQMELELPKGEIVVVKCLGKLGFNFPHLVVIEFVEFRGRRKQECRPTQLKKKLGRFSRFKEDSAGSTLILPVQAKSLWFK